MAARVISLAGVLIVSLVGLGVALLAAAPHPRSLFVLATAVWFVLPGAILALRIYRPGRGARLLPLVIGAVWGYAVSVAVLLALWVAGVRSAWLLLAGSPIVAAAVFAPLAAGLRLTPPAPDRRDLRVLALLLLVIPLVVAVPWRRVGQLTPDGRTYRAYFTADFVWRMAVAAEVAHGDVPPRNQFYRGDDLRYYWAADLLPAVEYRTIARAMRLEDVLLANALVVDILFVAFLFAFTRQWTASAPAAGIAAAAAMLLGSFEGTERVIDILRTGVPWESLKGYNIDAITRWVYHSLPVDDLHRALFWKPQHLMGYALGCSALLAVWESEEPPGARVMILAGTALGLAVFFSSFSAIMLTCIVAVVAGARYLSARRFGLMIVGAASAAVPLVIAAGATLALHYVDRAESLIRILVNPTAMSHPVLSIILSFGPMLVAGIAGAVLGVTRGSARHVAPLVAAVIVLFLFYFFVDVRDHQYVYVGWRAGDILFIFFSALAGFALQELWRSGRAVRAVTLAVGIVLGLAAVPTLAIDLYNTQDTDNRSMGPGFRWTVVLSKDELAALEWIRRYTPPDALVQVEPKVRGRETWAYVPAFAERRMSAGLPISMVPVEKYEKASAKVTELYQASDPNAAHALASSLAIDYLVVAPPEREAYPKFEEVLTARPDLFQPVFRNGSVSIYYVERPR